jgi:hypothetical protein
MFCDYGFDEIKKEYFFPYNYFEYGIKFGNWGDGPGYSYAYWVREDGSRIYTSPLGLYDTSEFYVYILIPLFLFLIYRLVFPNKIINSHP